MDYTKNKCGIAQNQSNQEPEESESKQTKENIQVALNIPCTGNKGEQIIKKNQRILMREVNKKS